jgi:hypothetical protein
MSAEFVLIILNLILGFGFAIPITLFLKKTNTKPTKFFFQFIILISIYFAECLAMIIGMGIPVFSIVLAFVWGFVFSSLLQNRALNRQVLKSSLFLALYSCLPAASFIVVPILMWISGSHILSAEEGARFGIPEFLHLPWPLNTILGFYAALAIGAVVLKTLITTGIIRSKESQAYKKISTV